VPHSTFLSAPIYDAAHNRRTALLASIYAAVICASLYLAYELRFDFIVPEPQQQERMRLLPVVVGVKVIALIAARQLGTLLTYFSIPDLIRLFWAMGASSILLLLPRVTGISEFGVPRGVVLADFLLCFGALCCGRILMRLYRERLSGQKRTANGVQQQQRIAIIGAGDAGASLAKEFISHPTRGFRPVMFFDDDPQKHGKLVHGIPVVGRPEVLPQSKEIATLAKAVIAMPSATAKRIGEIVTIFTQQGLKVETLPSLEELASGRVRASRIRPVEVQDLLGREAVNLDASGIRHAVEQRCVVVTGAGGSIGGELCRQIAALNPKRLLMIEQSEAALFLIEQELNELALGGVAVPLVADVLDIERMNYIFSRYQPEIVFHAAAHKHVFLMERQPAEAIRNNSFGTRQLAEIAAAHGVDAFVLISTDKAINPTNVMGATKRLAELQLMQLARSDIAEERNRTPEEEDPLRSMDAELRKPENSGLRITEKISNKTIGFAVGTDTGLGAPAASIAAEVSVPVSQVSSLSPRPVCSAPAQRTKFMAVRFGNVLGSSGSVIPIFKRQIANGGPVTVTHPDVTRYFMTIPEAVGLVLQSFVIGKGGEIFVLDMGQPVKIVDLAKQMIELSGFRVGEDIEIKFTGLKPGEKLFEELQHHTEDYAPTAHPRIMQFRSRGHHRCDVRLLRELEVRLHQLDSNQLKLALTQLVPEYKPFLD
jgi:FlaA1/EpsC-like NDP-sugar epimerase